MRLGKFFKPEGYLWYIRAWAFAIPLLFFCSLLEVVWENFDYYLLCPVMYKLQLWTHTEDGNL